MNSEMSAATNGPDRPGGRRRFIAVALVAPLALALAAVIVQLVLLPHAPRPVAVHWGPDGAADGFGPPWTYPAATALLGVAFPLVVLAPALRDLRRGAAVSLFRFAAAVSLGTSVMFSVLMTWLLAMQAGASTSAEASGVALPLIVSTVLALAAGAAAWFVLPGGGTAPAADPVDPLALAPGEVAVWMQTTSRSTPFVVTVVVATVFLAGAAVLQWLTGTVLSAVIATVVALLVLGLLVGTMVFHVRVDASGLSARSTLGVFRFHVPVGEIASVAVVQVNALGEFGGIGLRRVPGRFGIVMRSGDALELTRTNGRRFLITVDDPGTAAALLQTYIASAPAARA